jgi:putative transcriptional regulator
VAGWCLPAQSQAPAEPVLLVASPSLRAFYEHTVLVAVPTQGNRHIGFIINRPTDRSLASLFPEHAPSKKVISPVYLGGPEMVDAIFAMVRAKEAPAGDAFPLLPGLFVVADGPGIDRIIENTPNEARYFAGFVAWKPGELDAELERGFWSILKPEVDMLFRDDPLQMWEELTKRARALSVSRDLPYPPPV